MGLNHTLHRLLSDPDVRERAVLETDIAESDAEEGNASASFLNSMAGDLDARVIGIHKNTNQRLIIVTQDKTLLTLKRNIAQLGKREWIAPFSTLTTILIALVTSNFKRAIGLGPAEWRAMFIVSGLISAGWLAFALKKAMKAKNFHDVITDICFELGARQKPEHKKASQGKTFSASTMIAACKIKKTRSQKSKI